MLTVHMDHVIEIMYRKVSQRCARVCVGCVRTAASSPSLRLQLEMIALEAIDSVGSLDPASSSVHVCPEALRGVLLLAVGIVVAST
jgi:hypothetical protein